MYIRSALVSIATRLMESISRNRCSCTSLCIMSLMELLIKGPSGRLFAFICGLDLFWGCSPIASALIATVKAYGLCILSYTYLFPYFRFCLSFRYTRRKKLNYFDNIFHFRTRTDPVCSSTVTSVRLRSILISVSDVYACVFVRLSLRSHI